MQIKKPGVSIIFSFLVIGCLFSNACTSGNPNDSDHGNKDISAKEAHQMIQDNLGSSDFVILDTRSPNEYKSGHLENSVFINFSDPDFMQELEMLDKNKKYLLYCRSGNRSGQTLILMKKMGFIEAYNLKGGIISWSKNGYNVVK